jgi:DNA helicase-4
MKIKKEYEFLFIKSTVELNDEQKTAIITDDKHNLIVAAAGSGKTEVLIIRIAYLVCREQKKMLENRILVLAFQKKAAEEIEKRLTERFGINIKVKTFHSFGLEILKKAHLTRNIFNSTYNNRIKDLYERAEKDPSFQNKLIDYIKNFGDEEQLKQKSDFEKKEQWYCYMRNLRYTTLNGTQVKSEEEKAIMDFLLSHKINGKNIKILYEHPAKWMKYTDEKRDIIIPKPDFFLPEYDIYIEHWALDKKGRVPEWFKGNNPTKTYKRGMKAKIERFKQQKKYSLVETTSGEFKQKDFFENFEKKLIEEITNKNPETKNYLSVMDYSELVKIVWKTCRESMNRNFLNVETFINKAKTNGLTPQNIQERLEKETWSPKQKAFAEIALVIYHEYEKELHNANEIDFNDMINLALIELKNNKSLFENVFDHILIDEYQDISKQRCQLIKELMRKNNNCKLFCVGDDWQSIMVLQVPI